MQFELDVVIDGGDRIAELVRAKDEALIHEDFHRYDEVTAVVADVVAVVHLIENLIELPHRNGFAICLAHIDF